MHEEERVPEQGASGGLFDRVAGKVKQAAGSILGNRDLEREGQKIFRDDTFGNEVDQESESGDVSIGFDVSNTGRYASQCTPATQFGNTGNFQNGSSFVQGSGSELDDFEPEGIEVSFGGSQDVSCPNTIEQSSAASS